MNLKRKTHRRVGRVKDYGGVCNTCGSPIFYKKSFMVIEVKRTPDYVIVVPADVFLCPYCGVGIETIRLYKTMNVSAEFKEMAEKHE